MDIGLLNSVSSTAEVKSVKNSTYTQDSQQKVDYSHYSMNDLIKIPYEEAKANNEQIKERKEELIQNGLSEEGRKESAKLFVQTAAINYSSNDTFNKSFYETLQNSDKPEDAVIMSFEIKTNLSDYYYGKNVNASFVVSNDEIHSNKDLTKAQINSIDFSDFVSTMLTSFKEDLNNASKAQDSVKEQYQLFINSYSSFQDRYENYMKEPYYG